MFIVWEVKQEGRIPLFSTPLGTYVSEDSHFPHSEGVCMTVEAASIDLGVTDNFK